MMKQYALVFALGLAMAPASFATDQTGQGAGQPAGQSSGGVTAQGQSQPGSAGQSSAQPGQSGVSQPGQSNSAQPAGARQSGAEQAMSPEQTKDCVKMLSSMNEFEIQAGELAQQRAQDPQIKDYAQKIVQEHQQATDQIKQIAQAVGVDVSSNQLDDVHKAKLAELQKKQGEAFDKCYIFGQAGGHLTAVLGTQYAAQTAQNDQLKQFLMQLQPKLQQHLQQAMQISGAGSARMASERIPGSREGNAGTGNSYNQSTPGQSGQTNQSGQGSQGTSGGAKSPQQP